MMLPGTARLKVELLPLPELWKTAVGFDVSMPLLLSLDSWGTTTSLFRFCEKRQPATVKFLDEIYF
jgi:hypothetical protein